MFGHAKAFSSFTVNNLDKAKEFYHTKLGLEIQLRISEEGVKLFRLNIGDPSGNIISVTEENKIRNDD
jgi:catechol 2,3-dioxygenase-like lactoylglutathione lyase family enzyme